MYCIYVITAVMYDLVSFGTDPRVLQGIMRGQRVVIRGQVTRTYIHTYRDTLTRVQYDPKCTLHLLADVRNLS